MEAAMGSNTAGSGKGIGSKMRSLQQKTAVKKDRVTMKHVAGCHHYVTLALGGCKKPSQTLKGTSSWLQG
jgi:hypothetical protein